MSNTSRIEIKKFNRQNFELWKLKMEDLLVDREQWIVVKPRTKPTGTSNEDWKKTFMKLFLVNYSCFSYSSTNSTSLCIYRCMNNTDSMGGIKYHEHDNVNTTFSFTTTIHNCLRLCQLTICTLTFRRSNPSTTR